MKENQLKSMPKIANLSSSTHQKIAKSHCRTKELQEGNDGHVTILGEQPMIENPPNMQWEGFVRQEAVGETKSRESVIPASKSRSQPSRNAKPCVHREPSQSTYPSVNGQKSHLTGSITGTEEEQKHKSVKEYVKPSLTSTVHQEPNIYKQNRTNEELESLLRSKAHQESEEDQLNKISKDSSTTYKTQVHPKADVNPVHPILNFQGSKTHHESKIDKQKEIYREHGTISKANFNQESDIFSRSPIRATSNLSRGRGKSFRMREVNSREPKMCQKETEDLGARYTSGEKEERISQQGKLSMAKAFNPSDVDTEKRGCVQDKAFLVKELKDEIDLRDVEPGSLLQFKRQMSDHWAVYLGDGMVCEMSQRMGKHEGYVHAASFTKTKGGNSVFMNNESDLTYRPLPKKSILKSCYAKMDDYERTAVNSEDFAKLCRYGSAYKPQTKQNGMKSFGFSASRVSQQFSCDGLLCSQTEIAASHDLGDKIFRDASTFKGGKVESDEISYWKDVREVRNEVDLRHVEPGSLLEFKRGAYNHWAVYMGDGAICELTQIEGNEGIYQITSFMKAKGEDKVFLNNSNDRTWNPLPREEILDRCRSKVGSYETYSLVTKNCEHFANDCRYGKNYSSQTAEAGKGLYAVYLGFAAAGIPGALATGAFVLANAAKKRGWDLRNVGSMVASSSAGMDRTTSSRSDVGQWSKSTNQYKF